jgi:hypothetical protein
MDFDVNGVERCAVPIGQVRLIDCLLHHLENQTLADYVCSDIPFTVAKKSWRPLFKPA